MRVRALGAGVVSLVVASGVSGQAARDHHFDYDATAPLDAVEVGSARHPTGVVHDLSYASPKGGRVPAYLVVPHTKGTHAAVIWGHWYWDNSPVRNRKEFLEEALALAGAGVVSLLTDGPVARPGHVKDDSPLNERQITDLVQQIVDMRRGADLLLARKDVDPKRLGYVGHSYNAGVGAFLSGIDRRFKAFVLMAGSLSDEENLKTDAYQKYRQEVGPEKLDAFVEKYSWTDPGKFIANAAPATVFLQFARQEDFLTPELALKHAAIVSDPKRVELYDAPHALNAAARRDRLAFLAEQLGFTPLAAPLIARIKDIEQPPEPKRP